MDRKIKAINAINSFYNSLTVDHVDPVELVKTTQQLESIHQELDERLLNLEQELKLLEQQIGEERQKTEGKGDDDTYSEKLRRRASITIVVDEDTDVEIVLIYGMTLFHNWHFFRNYPVI